MKTGLDGDPQPEVLDGRRKMTAWLERSGVRRHLEHAVVSVPLGGSISLTAFPAAAPVAAKRVA